MIDIFSRIKVLAGEYIEKQKDRERFLGKISLILNDYQIQPASTDLIVRDNTDINTIKMFLGVKKVEGCTDGTLRAYFGSIRWLQDHMQSNTPLLKATANDIRCVLAIGMTKHNWTATHANNNRRYWSSFYTWCHDEGLIPKNPMRQVKAIKGVRVIRMPFTEEEMEKMRNACLDLRERAMLEFLFSTACRVSEMQALNRSDINFERKEVKVFGKGQKERIVYLNAKAVLYLSEYLATRTDDCEALFAGLRFNSKNQFYRLGVSGVELAIRRLGKRADVKSAHPHRFRHTAATLALKRGMPIEQLRLMLGHENIDTTLIYAKVNDSTLRMNHEKYVN